MNRFRPMALCLLALLGSVSCDSGHEPVPPPGPVVAQPVNPYEVFSDAALRERIQAALGRARAGGKNVLLVFIADWCTDCREVIRVAASGPAQRALEEGYEVVFVEVGRFDRHQALLRRYRIDRIATLVVLDGHGQRVAQTTLEPISNQHELTSEALGEWLRTPRDHWTGANVERPEPLFPAEVAPE